MPAADRLLTQRLVPEERNSQDEETQRWLFTGDIYGGNSVNA
jgi:hypothetical protein